LDHRASHDQKEIPRCQNVPPSFFSLVCTISTTFPVQYISIMFFIKAKGNVVPLHTKMAYRGSGGIVPLNINLDPRWRCVVSLAIRPLYPRHPLSRRLCGPQSRLGRLEKRKLHFPCRDSNLGSSSPKPAHYINCDLLCLIYVSVVYSSTYVLVTSLILAICSGCKCHREAGIPCL
jgi:hypothetical protein